MSDEPTITLCVLCQKPVEDEDKLEGAELCNECAWYLDAKFGGIGDVLADISPDTPLPEEK